MFSFKRVTRGIALAAAGIPFIAAAQPPTSTEAVPTAEVSYAGIDLSSRAGIARLDGLIRAAAERLCEDRGVRDLARAELGRRCRDAALANAEQQVAQAIAQFRSPQLAAGTGIILRAR